MEVTVISRIRMATASPTSAPCTKTGVVTSCPPRRLGVIIGPQQPGAVLAMIVPPFSIGPSMGAFGSRTEFVNSETTTLRRDVGVLPSGMRISLFSFLFDIQKISIRTGACKGNPDERAISIRQATMTFPDVHRLGRDQNAHAVQREYHGGVPIPRTRYLQCA